MVLVFWVLFNLSTAAHAWQGTAYIADGDTPVYAKPNEKSKIVHTLSVGDQVLVGPRANGEFRIVKFKMSGKPLQGYVVGRVLVGWGLMSKASTQRKRNSMYFSIVESYQRQGKRELQTTSESIYAVSEFSGLSTYFAAGVDMPYGDDWSLRAGLVMRRTYMEGDAQPEDTATQYKFSLEQEFIGVEAGLRYRPRSWGAWSFMGSAEFSKGTSVKMKVIEGPALDDSGVDLPYFMVFLGSVLYNKIISENFAFEPGVRFGAVATAEPVVLLAEGLLNLRYHF